MADANEALLGSEPIIPMGNILNCACVHVGNILLDIDVVGIYFP
jgi:hypothetical protein